MTFVDQRVNNMDVRCCAVDHVCRHADYVFGDSGAVQAAAGCVVVDARAAIHFVDLGRRGTTADVVRRDVHATWDTSYIRRRICI